MKLNLHVLRDDLAPYVRDARLVSEKTRLNCAPVRPYVEGTPFVEGNMYVARADQLPEDPEITGESALVCIGEPPQAYREAPIDLLVLDESLSIVDALDMVADIETRYESWDCTLRELLLSDAPLEKFGEVSQPLFENPLYCQAPGFKVMFLCTGDLEGATPEQRERIAGILGRDAFEPGSKLSEQTIIRLFSFDEYLEADDVTGLSLFENERTGTRAWCYNIGSDGAHFGRLLDFEVYRPLTDKDSILLNHLVPYVARALKDISFSTPFDTDSMFHCINDLLTNGTATRAVLELGLREMEWNEDDLFFCMTLEPAAGEVASIDLQEIAVKIDPLLPFNYHLVFDGKLVYIFDLDALNMSYEEISGQALPVFRDMMLRAGTSNPFSGIERLNYFFRQAKDAMAFGLTQDPDKWHFRYEDYSMSILLDRCMSNQPADVLQPRGLHRLAIHDKEHGTHLVEMLDLYLKSNMSVTETARASYSSRSTCIRHLQQIVEISQLDLDDPDVRLELGIAFLAAKRQKSL